MKALILALAIAGLALAETETVKCVYTGNPNKGIVCDSTTVPPVCSAKIKTGCISPLPPASNME